MSDFDKEDKSSYGTFFFDDSRDVFGSVKEQAAPENGILMIDEAYVMLSTMKGK